MTHEERTEEAEKPKEFGIIEEEPRFEYKGPHRKDIINTLFDYDQETDGDGHNVGNPYLVTRFGYMDNDEIYDNLEDLLQAVHDLIESKVAVALLRAEERGAKRVAERVLAVKCNSVMCRDEKAGSCGYCEDFREAASPARGDEEPNSHGGK